LRANAGCAGAAQDFEKAGSLRDREMELKSQISAITAGAKEGEAAEQEAGEGTGPLVTDQDIANIVAQWTGIPIEKARPCLGSRGRSARARAVAALAYEGPKHAISRAAGMSWCLWAGSARAARVRVSVRQRRVGACSATLIQRAGRRARRCPATRASA